MKKNILMLSTLVLFSAISFGKTTPEFEQLQSTGISFTENKGQIHDQNYKCRPDVLYGVMSGNMAVHIKKTGISYQLYRVDKYKETEDLKTKEKRQEIDEQTIYRIDLSWLNANINFTKSEDEALAGYNNYYLENCPDGALNVKSYKGITLHNLYKGIDLHYYEKNGELKHDYIVAAHADYKQIQLQVEGAEISVSEDGSLILTTPLGKVQEGAPIVFQKGKQLKAKWTIKNKTLSFEIENYQANYELIIDPVTRIWGTYYGGSGDDNGNSCSTDANANVFMAGYTTSTGTRIATVGSHQSTYGGNGDAFLVKFNSNGVRQWGTFYGGSSSEYGASCAVDLSGNVYMAGSAGPAPSNVIATPGSHQTVYAGNGDAFLVKFNSNGIRQWGTYYGGSISEEGNSCATDALGNVYLTGVTTSTNQGAIATIGSHQSAYGGGSSNYYDAFLVKFNSAGIRQWGTYYGGPYDDKGWSCATDASGNVYMTGLSGSINAIATVGSHQATYGGNGDAFLVKFDGTGNRIWATYYGGTGYDEALSCTTDVSDNVYMTGTTDSNIGNVIATSGSHQPTFGGGSHDGFFVKFDGNGSRQWGTYYGGTGDEWLNSCVTDPSSNVYMAGITSANTGTSIATSGSHQTTFAGGTHDAFLVKFDANGIRQWGTYYGGNMGDNGVSCAVDASGNVYMVGGTGTSTGTVIATSGSHQTTRQALYDAFLVKFDACNVPAQPVTISGSETVCNSSESYTYSVTLVANATSYIWSLPAAWSYVSGFNSVSATPGVSGIFSVTATNSCGASSQQTLSVMVSDCTDIKENSQSSFGIKYYPNPTNGIINLELDSENEVTIVNATGQIVYSSNFSYGTHQINLENLAEGIYVLRLENGSDSRNIKLIFE